MKIVDVKTYVVGNPPPHRGGLNWVFLKLVTDSGIHGFGEAYWVPFDPETVVRMIEDLGARYAIGADPFQIEALWRNMYRHGHPDVTRMAVISAFEMACWDIVGKEVNQPVYNLLGGRINERLRSYSYIYPSPEEADQYILQTDPERAPVVAAEYVKRGFTAVKFDPALPLLPSDPRQLSLEALDRAERVVRNIREAVGTRCDLLIGTHAQMTTSSAIRLAKRVERYDPLWIEEPVPLENRDEMARVARSTSIPVATGERLSTKFEFRELLEKQAAAILQPALGRVGGILEAKKIAGMAEAYYAHMAPHLWCGPVELAASIQLGACSPNFLILEIIDTLGGFYAEILKKPFRWEEGYVIPPDEPGLGIELNEEVMAKHPRYED